MAIDIVVPTLGESVSDATIARWMKQAGEAVKQDEPIVELEMTLTQTKSRERGWMAV